MAFHIRAQSPGDFDAWIKHMQSKGPTPPPKATAAAGDSLRTAVAGARVQQKGDTAAASPAGSDPLYAQGEKLFTAKGCIGCHSLQAYEAPTGLVGPNLANVGARSYIAAGWLKNSDENLERWIRNAQAVKVGVLMPNLGVTADEARALRTFLRAHN
jgi:cytochrome c1